MPRPAHTKSRFDLNLIELVRPPSYWPHPYSVEQAFQAFRWMIKTGDTYREPGRWGSSGVREVLSASSGVGLSGVAPIKSLEDLRQRFHYALLADGGKAVEQWRDDHGVRVGGRVTIPYAVHSDGHNSPAFTSPSNVKQELDRMLEPGPGQTMKMSLNCVHHDVRTLHSVEVRVFEGGFKFVLWYGDAPKSELHSHWDETIAASREGETFLQTFARARENFDLVVNGIRPSHPIDLEDMFWSGSDRNDPDRAHIEYQLSNDFRTPPKEIRPSLNEETSTGLKL
jgi:hypothetical protein